MQTGLELYFYSDDLLVALTLATSASLYMLLPLVIWHWPGIRLLGCLAQIGVLATLLPVRLYDPLQILLLAFPMVLVAKGTWIYLRGRSNTLKNSDSTSPDVSFSCSLLQCFLAVTIFSVGIIISPAARGVETDLRWFDVAFSAFWLSFFGVVASELTLWSRPLRSPLWYALLILLVSLTLLINRFPEWVGLRILSGLSYKSDYLILTSITLFSAIVASVFLAVRFGLQLTNTVARRSVFATLFSFAAVGIGSVGFIYWHLLPPWRPSVQYPATNSCAEIFSETIALRKLKGGWPTIASHRKRNANQLADELQETHDRIIQLSTRTGVFCLPEFMDGLGLQMQREDASVAYLTKIFAAETNEAFKSKQMGRGMRYGIANLRISHIVARGGITVFFAHFVDIERWAIEELVTVRERFDSPQRHQLLPVLEHINATREPLEDTHRREKRLIYDLCAWHQRVDAVLREFSTAPPLAVIDISELVKARDTTMRLLILDLRLRNYAEHHGCYPGRLDAVIAPHETELLADPFTSAPFTYRRSDGSFLLYSAGKDCHDNGGVFVKDTFADNSGIDFHLDNIN